MKRLIAALLCLAMLACLLAACGPNGNTPDGGGASTTPSGNNNKNNGDDTNKLKLTQYTIIYPKKASVTVKDAATELAEAIEPMIEDEVKISADEDAATADADAKEILIGSTNRQESRTYYEATPDFKYDVYQNGNKIVLAGYSDSLTAEAVAYFIETYVDESDDGKIESVVDYTGKWEDTLVLSKGGQTDFGVSCQNAETKLSTYFLDITTQITTKLQEKTGTKIARTIADLPYQASKKEVMIGRYTHTQLSAHYDALQMGGYMISVIKNKILLCATNEESYGDLVKALDKLVASYTLYGTKDVGFPVGLVESNGGIQLLQNMPMPNVMLKKVIKAGNDAYLAIFPNATPAVFTDYCNALEAAGYTEYTKTNFDGGTAATKNYFATYVSDERTVDIGFYENDDTMNVSVSPKGKLTLPTTSEPAYTPVDSSRYPVILTQVGTAEFTVGDAADCYVIRLADGSFIVFDTAFGTYNSTTVGEEIFKVLRKQAPDPNNIVISAFMLSHPHLDHVGGFAQFARIYASNKAVKVKQVVYNFPDISLAPSGTGENTHINNTETAIKRFSNIEIVKPRSGNVLYYPGVKFNVLYTQEDLLRLFNDVGNLGNATSMVVQMVTADGTKTILGGDYWAAKTNRMVEKRYGSFLESYVVSLFHHGIGGGADENGNIYKAIKPKIVLWPMPWSKMDKTDSTVTKYFSDSVWNKYFTTGKTEGTDGAPGTGGFEEGKIHSTPNANGVLGWFVSDDGIQIVKFNSKDNVSVFTYPTRQDYYNS